MFDLKPLTTNELILVVSAIILLVYTIFTLLLWWQSVIQTNIKLMPIPVIYVRQTNGIKSRKFRIRNLGYGPLLNIQIEEFILNLTDTGDSWKLKLTMEWPNVLAVGEERDLITETFKNGEKMEGFNMGPHLDPEFANLYIPIAVSFEDIRGVKYQVTIAMGKGQLAIIKPVKRVRSLKDRVWKWLKARICR